MLKKVFGKSKLNPICMTIPGSVSGICIFPQIDSLDFDSWYKKKFKRYLRNLLKRIRELIKTGIKLELHIVVGHPGIPLPVFFLKELKELGINIIEHSKREVDSLENIPSFIEFSNL